MLAIESSGSGAIRNRQFQGRDGWTYSETAQGAFAVRKMAPGTCFDAKGPGVFGREVSLPPGLVAVLNTRTPSYLLRCLAQTLDFDEAYVPRVPLPGNWPDSLKALEFACLALKSWLVARDPTERSFAFCPISGNSLLDAHHRATDEVEAVSAVLHSLEGMAERHVMDAYGLHGDDVSAVLDETGTPVGWHPIIEGYDSIPPLPNELNANDVLAPVASELRVRLAPGELTTLKQRLSSLYQAGPGGTVPAEEMVDVTANGSESDEQALSGARIPIPIQTFIEELSRKIEVHPTSVYWLLRELREKDSAICVSEFRRFVENYFSISVLRLLGHRWLNDIDVAEFDRAWPDPDGIVPVTEGTTEATLLARVRARIAEDFGGDRCGAVERQFEGIVGKPLSAWLAADLFKRHISQFRKRPIAWQLSSSSANYENRRPGRGTGWRAPAFSCFVYYNRLDADLPPKLRTQYVGPLRASFQTELASLEKARDRTADQDARRLDLESKIEELKAFDAHLEQLIVEGFRSAALDEIAAKEPIDSWTSRNGLARPPSTREAFLAQERRYDPDLNEGVRVNIAPLQLAGLLASDVLARKDVEVAIADRAAWRADERRWCREGKLPEPGWWAVRAKGTELPTMPDSLPSFEPAHEAALFVWAALHAAGGSLGRMSLVRAFALRSQPALLRKLAPQELRTAADQWAERIGQRTTPTGTLAKVIADLAARDGIRLMNDGGSRSTVAIGGHTPSADKVDNWFRFEARLALGVLPALESQHLQELDAGISGDDQKLLAAGAA